MLAGELSAAVLAAQCENGGRASTGGNHSISSQGHAQHASAADSPAAAAAREYALGAPGTERPYGPETASVAAEGKEGKRHFRQSHCHDPEMNAEEEGKAVDPDQDERVHGVDVPAQDPARSGSANCTPLSD